MRFVVRVFIQYGHTGDDEPVDHDAQGDNEDADADFHPMGEIALAGGQMPVESHQRYVEPNALRTFAVGESNVYWYFEIYNLESEAETGDGQYVAMFTITDAKGRVVAKFSKQHKKPGNCVAHSLQIPVDHFFGGDYRLTIEVEDPATGKSAATSRTFSVLSESLGYGEGVASRNSRNTGFPD